jgi:hypothetical protein
VRSEPQTSRFLSLSLPSVDDNKKICAPFQKKRMVKKIQKVLGIALGATLLLGGVGGGVGYYLWNKNKKRPARVSAYDPFAGIKRKIGTAPVPTAAATQTECEASCTKDVKCTSYSWNGAAAACMTSAEDPVTSWLEDPNFTMYVKRDSTAAPSSWGAWGVCPVTCGGTDKTVQTRACIGKCPGPTTHICGQTPCSKLQKEPAGLLPSPMTKGLPVTPTPYINLPACEKACMDNPDCTGLFWYSPGMSIPDSCSLFADTVTSLIPDTNPAWAATGVVETRVPSDAGTWGAVPACKCNQTQVTRTCSDPTKKCWGASTIGCPNVPCAYDAFAALKS